MNTLDYIGCKLPDSNRWNAMKFNRIKNRPLNRSKDCKERFYIETISYFDENGIFRKESVGEALKNGVKGVSYSQKEGAYYICGYKMSSVKFTDDQIAYAALGEIKPGDTYGDFIEKCKEIEHRPKYQRRILFESKISERTNVAARRDGKGNVSEIEITVPLCYSDIDKAYEFSKFFYNELKSLCVNLIRKECKDVDPHKFRVENAWVCKACCFTLSAVPSKINAS